MWIRRRQGASAIKLANFFQTHSMGGDAPFEPRVKPYNLLAPSANKGANTLYTIYRPIKHQFFCADTIRQLNVDKSNYVGTLPNCL